MIGTDGEMNQAIKEIASPLRGRATQTVAGMGTVLAGQLANRAVALDRRQGPFALNVACVSAETASLIARVSRPHIGDSMRAGAHHWFTKMW
jgi:hypothetical protein